MATCGSTSDLRRRYEEALRRLTVWERNVQRMRSVFDELATAYNVHAGGCFLLRWGALTRMIEGTIAAGHDVERLVEATKAEEEEQQQEQLGSRGDVCGEGDLDDLESTTSMMLEVEARLTDELRNVDDDTAAVGQRNDGTHVAEMTTAQLEEAVRVTESKIHFQRIYCGYNVEKMVRLRQGYETARRLSWPCQRYAMFDYLIRTAIALRAN